MKTRWMATLVLAAAAWGSGTALAHGDAKARHGGVVRTAHDLSFELVAQPGGAALYIEDHDKPMPTAGMGGKLLVLSGASKSSTPLEPAGDRLVAKGVELVSGSKAVASVVTADKKTITVRFSIK